MSAMDHCPIPCPQHPTYSLTQAIQVALAEDAGDLGDVTTLATIKPETQAVATFLAKADGIIAGLAVVDMVAREVDPLVQVEWRCRDGDCVSSGQTLGVWRGPARSILVAERVALNFMQRMSGIATATAAMVGAAKAAGTSTQILETRKTVPGLRVFDKWAVLIGGGTNHRMGLYDMMMVKDNHIAAAGGITAAVQRAEEYISAKGLQGVNIEVETRTLQEVEEVVGLLKATRGSDTGSHVTRIMLDNMVVKDASKAEQGGVDVGLLQEAMARIGDLAETEASGNVSLETVQTIASTGVTYISVGALTHSVKALDISLNIETL